MGVTNPYFAKLSQKDKKSTKKWVRWGVEGYPGFATALSYAKLTWDTQVGGGSRISNI